MDVTFNTASRFLQRLAVPAFPDAHDQLLALAQAGNIVDAFKTCFPEKWPKVGRLGLHDLDGEQMYLLQQTAVSAVAALFPVQEDYMDELIQEKEPLQIHPENCGFAWDDEWLGEVFQDPTQLSPDSDLAMFFKTLWIANSQFDEEEGQHIWGRMQAHFGYPCPFPKLGETARAREFQWDKFFSLVEAEGLGQFKRAVDVALCDTDNLFLDTSPEDYGYGVMQIPDFNAENIQLLKTEWADAEKWLADYETCRELVKNDPAIYNRLANLWERACKDKSKPMPAKTLVEVFSGGTDESNPTLP